MALPRLTEDERKTRLRKAEEDGKVALQEYRAASLAEDEKTARLKALRLERDRLAAEAAASAVLFSSPRKRSTKRR